MILYESCVISMRAVYSHSFTSRPLSSSTLPFTASSTESGLVWNSALLDFLQLFHCYLVLGETFCSSFFLVLTTQEHVQLLLMLLAFLHVCCNEPLKFFLPFSLNCDQEPHLFRFSLSFPLLCRHCFKEVTFASACSCLYFSTSSSHCNWHVLAVISSATNCHSSPWHLHLSIVLGSAMVLHSPYCSLPVLASAEQSLSLLVMA